VKRHAPFEPPEYLAWQPDEELLREYQATIDRDPKRAAAIRKLSPVQLLEIYAGLVRNRLTDIALKRLVRQGVISKAWLGTGEEAATIGPVHALRRPRAAPNAAARALCDVVAPMIRNAGATHEMGMPVVDTLRAYMGTGDGPSRGRDGHYGDLANGVLAPISHVGDVVPVVTGIAMSFLARGTDRVALTWIGDGSVKAGVAHEGLNLAAVRKVPAIFIIQNNQVALGTRLDQHHLAAATDKFAQWPKAYGMWGGVFDGNNVLDAYALTALAVERCRRGEGPALLVAETFRMGGHATHDEAEARRTFDAALFAHWGKRDPVAMFEEHLVRTGISRERLAEAERAVEAEVDAAEAAAIESRAQRMPAPESALAGVYAEGGTS
jgi:TPP-dependent pyruvate/acetoin dehydrogenase alpha subunit